MPPGGHVFWWIKFVLAISTKLFWSLVSEDPQSFCYRDKPCPLAAMFLMDQIRFSYFCRGSPSDHFCHIIFNFDHRFQRRWFLKFFHRYIIETGHYLWQPCFLNDHIRFSYYCRWSPSDYFYYIILNSDHRFQRKRSAKNFLPQKATLPGNHFFDGSNFFQAIFVEGHLRKIPMKFDKNWSSCHLNEIVDNAWWRTLTDPNSSLLAIHAHVSQKNLISQTKHMLWVLKRTLSMRRFFFNQDVFWAPKTYVKTNR